MAPPSAVVVLAVPTALYDLTCLCLLCPLHPGSTLGKLMLISRGYYHPF